MTFNLSKAQISWGLILEANSISLQLVFPINIMEFWRRGHVLEGCEAELSFVLYKDGAVSTDYENRMIMLNGIVQQPVFGDPLEPVGALWRSALKENLMTLQTAGY